MPRPFLILTLRRSGGTALTQFLAGLPGTARTWHEPLNPDRAWGAITKRYQEDEDPVALRAALVEKAALGQNLKHCCEVVPTAVTRAIIASFVHAGHRVVILQRGREEERLKSLFLAMSTGAWGPAQAEEIYPAIREGRHAVKPVRMALLENRRKTDLAELGRAAMTVRALGQPFDWLVFEELYRDPLQGRAALAAVARALGHDLSDQDPGLDPFFARSGQGSGRIEDLVPAMEQFHAWSARHFG